MLAGAVTGANLLTVVTWESLAALGRLLRSEIVLGAVLGLAACLTCGNTAPGSMKRPLP